MIILYGIGILLLAVAIVVALWFIFKEKIRALLLAWLHRPHHHPVSHAGDCYSGTLALAPEEIARIKQVTGLSEEEFIENIHKVPYLRRDADGHCLFLAVNYNSSGDPVTSCRIYPARPAACRRMPYLKYMGVNGIDPRCRANRNHLTKEDCRSWTKNNQP